MVERGAVLVAYDLGLGKTVLTIAAIEELFDREQVTQPGLVICLSSLKYQWQAAIHKFSDSHAIVIDGTPKQREAQYAQVRDWRNNDIDYVILNYEQCVNDWEQVRRLPRGFVVLDEATAIKSFRAKRSRRVKRLSSDYKFALTGTPIENGKPEEVFSIMQFVDPDVLGRFDLFDRAFVVRNGYGGVERYRNLPVLHKRLSEACVRKSQDDEDVRPHLPEVRHLDPLLITMDPAGAKVYRRITEDLLADLSEAQQTFGTGFDLTHHYGGGDGVSGEMDAMRGRIMAKLGCLRQLCDHPELLRISADAYNDPNGSDGSSYAAELAAAGLLTGLRRAPKLDAVVEYLDDFLDQRGDHKAVVFSVFVPTLDILANKMGRKRCALYSGRMNAKQKEASKVRFQTDPDVRLLISSDAGGYGVDLPQANLLLNYDLPWSSGAATQRNGRIRRASSTWASVIVQDVLIKGSIEVRQWDALRQKGAVANAVVDGRGIDREGGVAMTLGSLTSFLLENTV